MSNKQSFNDSRFAPYINGVKVREMWDDFNTMRIIAERVDGEIFFVNRDAIMDGQEWDWRPIAESWGFCTSCGTQHPPEYVDEAGRCHITQDIRREKLHKLFMERVKQHGKQLQLR